MDTPTRTKKMVQLEKCIYNIVKTKRETNNETEKDITVEKVVDDNDPHGERLRQVT